MQSTSMPERGRTEAATGQTPASPIQCSLHSWCVQPDGHGWPGCMGQPVQFAGPLNGGRGLEAVIEIDLDTGAPVLSLGMEWVTPGEMRAYAQRLIEQASGLFRLAGEFEAARVAEMASAA